MSDRIVVKRGDVISVINERGPIRVALGDQGPRGLQGLASGGVRLTFDSTTSDADPGTGKWRANSATFASITKLWIDNTQVGGDSITAWLDGMDDAGSSTHRCILRVENLADATQWAEFNVTGSIVDKTGYREIVCTGRAQAQWPFTDADSCIASIAVTGVTGATGDPGTNGTNGTNGSNGTDAGMRWLFASSTTMADPSAGNIRFNNVTLASITALAISANNGETGNPSAADFIKTWDDSTTTAHRGLLIVKKVSAPENFVVLDITAALTDNTSWLQATVSYVVGAGSFSVSDILSIQFYRAGDAGGGLANVVEDTTPQLGGQLDVNGQALGDGILELLKFEETASAVNEVTVANAAAGNGPTLKSTGDDTNIDLNLSGKGTGVPKIGGAEIIKADGVQAITGGFKATPYPKGTVASGTYTPLYSDGNFQTATNGGAHTLAPPADDCTLLIQYTNNGSAGAITTSGFTKKTGDTISTTNGDDFFFYITKVGSFSHLHVQALQ